MGSSELVNDLCTGQGIVLQFQGTAEAKVLRQRQKVEHALSGHYLCLAWARVLLAPSFSNLWSWCNVPYRAWPIDYTMMIKELLNSLVACTQ